MFPVLFSAGNISISTFGIFLACSFVYGIFLIWRLSRALDLSEEKVLDLALITFLGGLIGSRLYFALGNPSPGFSIVELILVHRYPGFSFWGAFLGGWLTLFIFSRRMKMDFLQIADIASVGFLGGIILADIGCLMGGCSVGIVNHSFFAVNILGAVGSRFPTPGLEALLLALLLRRIWKKAIHFHQTGTIVSINLIFIGAIKFVTEPLREIHTGGYLLSAATSLLGVVLFYRVTGRNPIMDTKNLLLFPIRFVREKDVRDSTVSAFRKSWYNQKVTFEWRLKKISKVARMLNVRFSRKTN